MIVYKLAVYGQGVVSNVFEFLPSKKSKTFLLFFLFFISETTFKMTRLISTIALFLTAYTANAACSSVPVCSDGTPGDCADTPGSTTCAEGTEECDCYFNVDMASVANPTCATLCPANECQPCPAVLSSCSNGKQANDINPNDPCDCAYCAEGKLTECHNEPTEPVKNGCTLKDDCGVTCSTATISDLTTLVLPCIMLHAMAS